MDHRMLNILDAWVADWQIFIDSLEEANVWIIDKHDVLICATNPQGSYSPKVGYAYSMAAKHSGEFS